MRKYVPAISLLLLVALAACSGGNTATPPATATSAGRPTPTTALPSPVPTGNSTVDVTIEPGTVEPSECVIRPTAPLEGLPPISDEDWIKGNEDAPITLIEYADFM